MSYKTVYVVWGHDTPQGSDWPFLEIKGVFTTRKKAVVEENKNPKHDHSGILTANLYD